LNYIAVFEIHSIIREKTYVSEPELEEYDDIFEENMPPDVVDPDCLEPPAKRHCSISGIEKSAPIEKSVTLSKDNPRISTVKAAETAVEVLEYIVVDVCDVFRSSGILTHKDRVAIFQAIITYLYAHAYLSENHLTSFTVHEFVNLASQHANGTENVRMDTEPSDGTYSLF
jgi:hypothetical protein